MCFVPTSFPFIFERRDVSVVTKARALTMSLSFNLHLHVPLFCKHCTPAIVYATRLVNVKRVLCQNCFIKLKYVLGGFRLVACYFLLR
jgi:hypothetical protein